jgi:hypothetical protein
MPESADVLKGITVPTTRAPRSPRRQNRRSRIAQKTVASSPLKYGLADSLHRIFPHSKVKPARTLSLDAARGERVSFQIAVHNPTSECIRVTLALSAPPGISTRVRRVGYVPIAHANTDTPISESDGSGHFPGFVPDPLFDEDTLTLGPAETQAFWCNATVAASVKPKNYEIQALLTSGDKSLMPLTVDITAHSVVLKPRRDFPVVQWFYADALCDFYRCEAFDEAFWKIVEPYMRNMVEHFEDCIYVPLFTPPTDGVKRPTQLLKVTRSGSTYSFDWSDVKRWTDLSQSIGLHYFEWTHLFTQWGVKNAIRIYDTAGKLLWEPETGATSETYRAFLSQFLPEFKAFLVGEGLLERSFFHVSDEPHHDHLQNYRAARSVLKELAPWMKSMDALSEITFAHETDLPIPITSSAPAFAAKNIEAGVYFCCAPRGKYINRLMDTPLAKIRMSGWLFYRFQPKLFLHWGYNYWHKSQSRELLDPFTASDGGKWPGWAYGDTFCVYPGPNGPLDSIRWEVFAESMQDFALLQTLGEDPTGKLLRPIKDYAEFPKAAAWINRARKALLAQSRS